MVSSYSVIGKGVVEREKMSQIRVTPIGFESLGVRSMCTFIETPDVRVLIDAGVALGPRFRKLPHPQEYRARDACRARIREYAAKADVIVVSHYHNDHHTPNYTETVWLGSSREEAQSIYQDKLILAKDIRNSINFSQRRRGWMFQQFLRKIGSKCEVADGREFDYGATKVRTSAPVPHGEDQSELGWVIMTSVERANDKVLHTSDIQGPMSRQTTQAVMKHKPSLVILGGPPTYLEGIKVEEASIKKGIDNAARLVDRVSVLILDHHLLRSENWKDQAAPIFDVARSAKHSVMTAAEYMGSSPLLLESMRERLYEKDPPSEEFIKWTKRPREKRRLEDPPV